MENLNLDDNKSCTFDGNEYSHGSEICSGGKMLRCHDGEWEDIGEDCKSKVNNEYINENQTALYLDESVAKNDKSLLIRCVKFEFYPKDNNYVYLVNGCNECKKVRIHWWTTNKEAWTTHEVDADSVILIRKPYGNARMVTESNCK